MAMTFTTGLPLECRSFSRVAAVCASSGFSLVDDLAPQTRNPEDYLNALEEERRKIEGLRRELPLCMQLLQDAIEVYKEKPHIQGKVSSSFTDFCLRSPSDRVMEELKSSQRTPSSLHTEDEPGQNKSCEPNWTEECRPAAIIDSTKNCQTPIMTEKAFLPPMHHQAFVMSPKPHFYSSNNAGGAFTPFSRGNRVFRPMPRHGIFYPKDLVTTRDPDATGFQAVKSSALVPNIEKENGQLQVKESATKAAATGSKAGDDSRLTARKARRCWSPQLHRSFVNALQQLGGSEAATPKQIRELMSVEGLTNDEIKSHLQKYRLHVRRVGTMQSTQMQPPHVVLLSETWVPSYYTVHSAGKQASSLLQDNCSELGSSIDDEVHDPSCCEHKIPTHWSSFQGHLQFVDQPAQAYQPSNYNGRGESLNGGSGDSSCGSRKPMHELQDDEVDDARSHDGSSNGNQSRCTSEDDDSRAEA